MSADHAGGFYPAESDIASWIAAGCCPRAALAEADMMLRDLYGCKAGWFAARYRAGDAAVWLLAWVRAAPDSGRPVDVYTMTEVADLAASSGREPWAPLYEAWGGRPVDG